MRRLSKAHGYDSDILNTINSRSAAQSASDIRRGFAEGIAETFGEIGRGGKPGFICEFAYGFLGACKEGARTVQTHVAQQLYRGEICQSLYLTVELRTAKTHTGCKLVDTEFGIAHIRVNDFNETRIKLAVDVAAGWHFAPFS